MKNKGTIMIAGAPSSGTAMLSSLLGAHSKVAAVGELSNDKCSARNSIKRPDNLEDLYETLRKKLGVPWLVDSSRHPYWYERMVPKLLRTDRGRVIKDVTVFVVLHKPAWSVATSRAKFSIKSADELRPSSLETEINSWTSFYNGFRKIIENHGEMNCLFVPYEELVKDPGRWLFEIMWRCGLNFEERQLAGATMDSDLNEVSDATRKKVMSMPMVAELMEWLGR